MIVDDHEVVRHGIRGLLEAQPDFAVVAEAGSVREAVSRASAVHPELVIMDVSLGDGSGIDATRQIRAERPETKVLMLTTYADEEALFASILAGASGYVLKEVRREDLVRAVRAVGEGKALLDPTMTAPLLEKLRGAKELFKDERLGRLSPHEERILRLVADGKTNREIGIELGLSDKTVKNYVSSILGKLEVGRRAEAAAYLARKTSRPGALR